ncbi:hypothetical protein TrCOL_g5264 [Triparma columacea]|uniref:Uncharacterized protein n=1 Tax=Triparma columacea TaxID=722753 RepID=A0A9W7GHI3_9STRA|nr:hypothetical protein TrCOL_g5264 [Triparma columacea]
MYKAAIFDAIKGLRGKDVDVRSLEHLVETFVGHLLDNSLDDLVELDMEEGGGGGEVEDLVERIKGSEEWRLMMEGLEVGRGGGDEMDVEDVEDVEDVKEEETKEETEKAAAPAPAAAPAKTAQSFSLFDQLDMMDSNAASEYVAPAKILLARESEGLERAMEMLEKMEADDMCQTESWEGIKGVIGEALEGGGKRGVKIVMKFQKVLMPNWRGELLLMLIGRGRRVWSDLVDSITSITPNNLNKIIVNLLLLLKPSISQVAHGDECPAITPLHLFARFDEKGDWWRIWLVRTWAPQISHLCIRTGWLNEIIGVLNGESEAKGIGGVGEEEVKVKEKENLVDIGGAGGGTEWTRKEWDKRLKSLAENLTRHLEVINGRWVNVRCWEGGECSVVDGVGWGLQTIKEFNGKGFLMTLGGEGGGAEGEGACEEAVVSWEDLTDEERKGWVLVSDE